MKQVKFTGQRGKYLVAALLALLPFMAMAQQNIIINLAQIDGMPITPDNIFNYQVQSSGPGKVQVNGTIRYRNSNMSISYSFPYTLRQGMNMLNADDVHPQWQFSSSALQDLFFTYKVLPEGTFEYCVTVTPSSVVKESTNGLFDECLYYRSDDIFMINLIYPEDKAKLIEYNPMLSWMANYSFSSDLTYRIRVAAIMQGQNPVNAVMRNQPVYDESNLMQNSIVYPIYAKPLVVNQPYAWEVDAFYKGLLLGGSETWQFIIPDSLPPVAKANRSFIDIQRENGLNKLTALGGLKLKYILKDSQNDSLYLEITNDKNKDCPLKPNKLNATYGDNRYVLDLADSSSLKHMNIYTLTIKTKTKHEYKLLFQYVNPEFTH